MCLESVSLLPFAIIIPQEKTYQGGKFKQATFM